MKSLPLEPPSSSQKPLFQRLRRRLFWNQLRTMLQRSRLRVGLMVGSTAVLWGGLYKLFMDGLRFLQNVQAASPGSQVKEEFIKLFFGLFFLSLTGLMVFSMGLLLYGSLFRTGEAAFLLSMPARTGQVYRYKFHESLWLSGWGFMLLGTPLMVAYGVDAGADWYYYLLFLPFLHGFLLLAGSFGALGCLLIVNCMPRQRRQLLYVLLVVGVLLLVRVGFFLFLRMRPDAPRGDLFIETVQQLRPTQLWFLPSRWITDGLIELAKGDLLSAGLFLGLVWGLALLLYGSSYWMAARFYRRGYSLVSSAGKARRKYGVSWMDRWLNRLLSWTDPKTRLFVIKDLRTFRRDPVQWGQVVILGALMLLSYLSIPRLPQSQYDDFQRGLVALLNLMVLGLLLATYTSRFIFPMMSLEGTKFWILGLLPLRRERLILSKFAYAATITVTGGVVLTLLSGLMLRLDPLIVVAHTVTMFVLAAGLCGLSVGLGARLVNLKESNPSKIVTGFGGTVNLLASLAYVLIVVLIGGMLTFLLIHPAWRDEAHVLNPYLLPLQLFTFGLLLFVGVLGVFVPLAIGIRAFRRMEF